MQEPLNQEALVLDLDPIICNNTDDCITVSDQEDTLSPKNMNLPKAYIDNDELLPEILTITQARINHSPPRKPCETTFSVRTNILKEKYIDPSQGHSLTRYSTRKAALSCSKFEPVERRCNTSTDNQDEIYENTLESVKRSNRTNLTTMLYRNNKDFSSSFSLLNRSKSIDKTGSTSQNKSLIERKKSACGERPSQPIQLQRSFNSTKPRERSSNKATSLERNKTRIIDILRGEPGARHETSPDREILNVNISSVLVERKEAVDHFKKQGVQRYENKVLRQELDRQMKLLANRVKRLKDEEHNIKKNIKKTEEVTKKAIHAKQRYHEDLSKLENAKLQRLQEEQKTREKIKEEKMRRANNMKNVVTSLQNKKFLQAKEVKGTLKQDYEKMNETLNRDEEKKLKTYQSTSRSEKTNKCKRILNEYGLKEQANENHMKFLQEEHMRTLEIENKIREFAMMEEQLIDKIKVTHQMQIQAEYMMKKVLTTKVEKAKPLDLP